MDLTRISLMIKSEHYEKLQEMGVNISGYVRDLIQDNLNSQTITLSVSDELKGLYDKIISNTGEGDRVFEPYIKQALCEMLADKIKEMESLHEKLK